MIKTYFGMLLLGLGAYLGGIFRDSLVREVWYIPIMLFAGIFLLLWGSKGE